MLQNNWNGTHPDNSQILLLSNWLHIQCHYDQVQRCRHQDNIRIATAHMEKRIVHSQNNEDQMLSKSSTMPDSKMELKNYCFSIFAAAKQRSRTCWLSTSFQIWASRKCYSIWTTPKLCTVACSENISCTTLEFLIFD